MDSRHVLSCVPLGRDSLPLDAARTAFEWLVTGPRPACVDGRCFPGLPRRRVPLDELRDLLLNPDLPMSTVDPVWVHLVTQARDKGGAATVGCVGVALPALFHIAADLCKPFADNHHDIHAALLTGFLSELATIDLGRPWVMWRLRCAALRAGHLFIREALERPMPSEEAFRSREPRPLWGHEDFVLARAVAEGVITGEQAELIGATRLEPEYTLAQAAADWGVSYDTLAHVRVRAERRLVAWLREQAPHDDPGEHGEAAVEVQAIHTATIIAAAREARRPVTSRSRKARTVTAADGKPAEKVRGRVSKKTPESGVEGCGRKAATAPHTTSPDRPTGTTRRPSDPTPEVPRCA